MLPVMQPQTQTTKIMETLSSILAASLMLESHHDMLDKHNALRNEKNSLLRGALQALVTCIPIEGQHRELVGKHNELL